jgi:N-acetylglutamate synthase-like GNAT family acetyltransferase
LNIQIRKAKPTDGPAIAELLRSTGLFARLSNESAQATQERVLRHLALCAADNSHLVLVAQSQAGEILGYSAVHWLPYLILAGPEGYVSELFIKNEFRGRGIGGQLLDAIKAEAEQRGCSRLMLLNKRQRESYQRQFYMKHGWEEREDAANFVYHLSPLVRDDNPTDQIDQESWDAARQQGNAECQAKPCGADAKELAHPAANTGNDPVAS